MRVIVVEDDPLAADVLKTQLEGAGCKVEVVSSGAAGLQRFGKHDLDAAVVDMGLPDMDGVDLIAETRRRGMWAAILVASARAEMEERVRALAAGADDYLVKPFTGAEIVARLRALGRRAAAPRWAPLACGEVVVDTDKRRATVDGAPLKLSPNELALLVLLMRRQGETVTRKEILADAFGYEFDPKTNVINVHVANLRRKLRGAGVVIETVRGIGFSLQPRPG